MTPSFEKFIPTKSEAWRFSGFKGLDLSLYKEKGSTSVKNSKGMLVQGDFGDDPIGMPDALALPFRDFGSAEVEKLTFEKNRFWHIKTPQATRGEIYCRHHHLRDTSLLKFRALIEVEPDATLNYVGKLKTTKQGSCSATASRMVVAAGAALDFVLINDLSSDAINFNFIEIEAQENSKINLTILNLGSAYTRQEITAILKGRGADVKLRSLSIAKGAQEIDQRTLQIHEAPNAKSDLLFKNILSDNARTIFSGMIRVASGAQKTDAYQKNCNLLLSDDALANSLPGLEIEADDVRCSHGATCGKLDLEELFYLRSRGIPEAEAKQMLVGGFCQEILAGLQENLRAEIDKRPTL